MNSQDLLHMIWGSLPAGTPNAKETAETLTRLVSGEFNARVDKFIADTDKLAESYQERAREAAREDAPSNIVNYREGKADGLAIAAGRATRMKV